MNKGLLAKIALGIIVVALPVGIMFFSNKGDKNQGNQQEQSVGLESEEDLLADIENNLKDDEEESSDETESTGNENFTDESSQTKPSDNTNNNNNNNGNNNSNNSNDKNESNNSGNNSNSNNQGNVEDSTPSKSSSGSFQGFADSSFVEIKTGDTYNVYKVSDSAKKVLSSKEVGADIKFTYKNVGGQLHIVSAE